MHVVVVGGGITGLSAAHALLAAPTPPQVTLLEAGDTLGGKIRTSPFAGLPAVDEGADAFLARVPWATAIARERRPRRPVDLADQRQGRRVVGQPARHPRGSPAGDAHRHRRPGPQPAAHVARQAARRHRAAAPAHLARTRFARWLRARPVRQRGAAAARRPARRQHLRRRHRPLQPGGGSADRRAGGAIAQRAARRSQAPTRAGGTGVLRADRWGRRAGQHVGRPGRGRRRRAADRQRPSASWPPTDAGGESMASLSTP